MKNITICLLFLFSQLLVAQTYKKQFPYDVYQKGWAKVKSITGNYGFIDTNGKEVVPTVYAKIYKFGTHHTELALVKSITGNYGFIDTKG
jgi:hypothetical protein